MTKAERAMVLYLIYNGAPDCCMKCVNLNSPSCCLYNPKTGCCDSDKKLDNDRCIAGMVKYFEQNILGCTSEGGQSVELPCVVNTLSPKYKVIVFRGKDGELYKTRTYPTAEIETRLKEIRERVPE